MEPPDSSFLSGRLVVAVVSFLAWIFIQTERRGGHKSVMAAADELDEEPVVQFFARDAIPDDCPWPIQNCSSDQEAMDIVWMEVSPTLESVSHELRKRTVKLEIVSVRLGSAVDWLLVYNLRDGQRVFGRAPQVDIPDACCVDEETEKPVTIDASSGLRRRRQHDEAEPSGQGYYRPVANIPATLGCLYRVHDGLGTLVSPETLGSAMVEPTHNFLGTGYYLFPVEALASPSSSTPWLVTFARVDKHCMVAADLRSEIPKCVFLDQQPNFFGAPSHQGIDGVEDQTVLEFVADTIENLIGAAEMQY